MTAEEMITFEAQIAQDFNEGKIRAPVHLAGGNEAQLIEIFREIGPDDWIATSWRSHYHCLLKGVPKERLRRDILDGRSIALSYPEHRIISSAIVGGSLAIALGIALGIKRREGEERVWAFCGDMTASAGAFHECISYARCQTLPIRFVIENNGLSVCTPTGEAWGWNKIIPYQPMLERYDYKLPWPHAGAGVRVQF